MNFDSIYRDIDKAITKQSGLPMSEYEKITIQHFKTNEISQRIEPILKERYITLDTLKEIKEIHLIILAAMMSNLGMKRRMLFLINFVFGEVLMIAICLYFKNMDLTLLFGVFMVWYSIEFVKILNDYLDDKKINQECVNLLSKYRQFKYKYREIGDDCYDIPITKSYDSR